jgi:hypothetical protein
MGSFFRILAIVTSVLSLFLSIFYVLIGILMSGMNDTGRPTLILEICLASMPYIIFYAYMALFATEPKYRRVPFLIMVILVAYICYTMVKMLFFPVPTEPTTLPRLVCLAIFSSVLGIPIAFWVYKTIRPN